MNNRNQATPETLEFVDMLIDEFFEIRIINFLKENSSSINVNHTFIHRGTQKSMLQRAIEKEHFKLFALLFEMGATLENDIIYRLINGKEDLFESSYENSKDIMDRLLRNGFPYEIMMFIVCKKINYIHEYLLNDLLENKPAQFDINFMFEGKTILHRLIEAFIYERYEDEFINMLRTLLKNGANPSLPDENNKKPIVKILQDEGVYETELETIAKLVLDEKGEQPTLFPISEKIDFNVNTLIEKVATSSMITNTKERAHDIRKTIQKLKLPIGVIKTIRSIDELSESLDGIDSLIISSIGITTLPHLPASLKYLNCSNNPITELKTLPINLIVLICANCKLQSLPTLPYTLAYLDARNNQIKDIQYIPPKLYLSPVSKLNSEKNQLNSTNLLLTGNPLPIGFFNGYGSITEYSNKHIHRIINYKKDTIYTMILPKGTLLFRDLEMKYKEEETKGILIGKTYKKFPEFNVFFYPYPFVAELFLNTKFTTVFELIRDVEVVMGVLPSKNTRNDRMYSDYVGSCDELPHPRGITGNGVDPCFRPDFSKENPTLNGMFVLASMDAALHIENMPKQRYWSKYRTNFKDDRGSSISEIGIPEIILHPNENRYNNNSPLNYKFVMSIPRTKFAFDETWRTVDKKLSSGEWTIDLFTKMYVNYNSVSDEVKARCVPPEEPYKLHYLNTSYWNKSNTIGQILNNNSMKGGKQRRTIKQKKRYGRMPLKTRRTLHL